jgi:hypothetical protein
MQEDATYTTLIRRESFPHNLPLSVAKRREKTVTQKDPLVRYYLKEVITFLLPLRFFLLALSLTFSVFLWRQSDTEGAPFRQEGTAAPIADAASSFASTRLTVENATIDVTVAPGKLALPRTMLFQWITTSAQAVAHYYGRFPVSRLRLTLIPEVDSVGVRFGTTFGGENPHIKIWFGESTDESMLQKDWVMTHEMIHLAFPLVAETHHWLEEGLATYVEPLARFGIGHLSEEKVWQDLVRGLPHGLPKAGDQGLDRTHTWGRTYWGGALFCLLAELEIRHRTTNRKGLQDALRAIVNAGGTMEARWPLTRALSIGDQAIGAPVLMELYERMKEKPVEVDLAHLWQRLGIKPQETTLVLHNDAPLVSVRQAILAAARGEELAEPPYSE